MIINLFDPNQLPFGELSNNAFTPFYKDNEMWKSVSHYVYANLLFGTYRNLIRNSLVRDIPTKFTQYREKMFLQITRNILENGVRTLVAKNTQFRDLLLNTESKKLIYITNATLFDQEYPILGKNADGEGLNILGEIYEIIRTEEKYKQNIKKDDQEIREKNKDIINIILLVKSLQTEMLTNYNDFSSISDKTFDAIYDIYKPTITTMTYRDNVLLQQYNNGRLSNGKLISDIINDPDNIIFYVRDYYDNDVKQKINKERRLVLCKHFLYTQLKKKNTSLSDSELEKELDEQIQSIYNRGAEFTKKLYDDILKLYDDGKLEVPKKIEEKYSNKFISPIEKKIIPDDNDEPDEIIEKQSSDVPKPNDNNPELFALQQISHAEEINKELYTDGSIKPINIDDEETTTYIKFTDGPGSYRMFSPYHTGLISDQFQYPNLISYYYVKLIYFVGNMVSIKSSINIPSGGGVKKDISLSLKEAHRYIMIPECRHIAYECDQFNMKNYITDFSEIPKEIKILEDKNKILLLEAGIREKIKKHHNLQVLLTQNPNQKIVFQYAENTNPKKRFDDIIGIGPNNNGENYTGKILSQLRTKYLNEELINDKINQDVALVSHMFNNDPQLIGWFYSRCSDILNTVLLVCLAVKLPDNDEIYEIRAEFVNSVINDIYNSCNVSFDKFIEIEVPSQFLIRMNDEFIQKYRTYTSTDSKTPMKIELSSGAIVEIWKYSSWLMYELIAESSKYDQKDNIKLFLTNIVLNMTENDQECLHINRFNDPNLRNIKTCIVSAIINVLKGLLIIYNGKSVINLRMIKSILNIIIGKSVELKITNDYSNIFETILPKYTTLYKHIDQYNDAKNIQRIITILNSQYDYLDNASSDKLDITQLENQRIRNRINFFSSIPTRSPHTAIPNSDSDSTLSSDSDFRKQIEDQFKKPNETLDDWANRLHETNIKDQEEKGIFKQPITTTMLKQPDREFAKIRQDNIKPVSTQNIIADITQKDLMKNLSDEFDSIYSDNITDDVSINNSGGTFDSDAFDSDEMFQSTELDQL
jgi:predicted NAD-dependent protein-ADP-ribosyltransferase YbiA (DUF1768 family)